MALKVVWAYVGLIAVGVLAGIVYLRAEDRGLGFGAVTSMGLFAFILVLTIRAFAKRKDAE